MGGILIDCLGSLALGSHWDHNRFCYFSFVNSVQFSEQFKEVKEAARLVREKSQEKFELICPGLNIDPLQVFTLLYIITLHYTFILVTK